MSYSAHRPGRLDSQGRISFETDAPDGAATTVEDPGYLVREYLPSGAAATPAAELTDTAVLEELFPFVQDAQARPAPADAEPVASA
ncbi:MAG: hypothetical protein WA971_07855, partial [Microbacterium sp.]